MPVPRVNVPRSLRGLAAFQTITTGRIWVIPEAKLNVSHMRIARVWKKHALAPHRR